MGMTDAPMHRKTCLRITDTALQVLVNRLRRGRLTLRTGVSQTPSSTEWLLGSPDGVDRGSGRLELMSLDQFSTGPAPSLWEPEPTLSVGLGLGSDAGRAAGAWRMGGVQGLLNEVQIIAPGLPVLPLSPPRHPIDNATEETWSRTAGALSPAVWKRLTELECAILGVGRAGSLMAVALARLGVKRLTLIDPDTLEPHNHGEMDGTVPGTGGRKVDALARYLAVHAPHTTTQRCTESILTLNALSAVKQADVLISCVDRASARIAAAFLSAIYLRPLLDLGTGVFRDSGPPRVGADIRMILPGTASCLLCCGGIAGLREGCGELLHGTGASHRSRDFRQERAGSLRSLNQTAVGYALRLLEELVESTVTKSVWVQLDWDRGLPALRLPAVQPRPECPFCRLSAAGDDGVGAFLQSVRSLE